MPSTKETTKAHHKKQKAQEPDYGASSPGSRLLEKRMIKKSSYYEALLRERNAWARLPHKLRESFPAGKCRTIRDVKQLLPGWTQVDLLGLSSGDLHLRTVLLWKALVYANEAMAVPHSSRLPEKRQDMAIIGALEKKMLLDVEQIEPELTQSKAKELFGQARNDDRSSDTNAARDTFMARVSHFSAVKRILLWIENRKMSWAIVGHGFEPAPFEDMLRYFDDEHPYDEVLPGTIEVPLDDPGADDHHGQLIITADMAADALPKGWGAIRDAGTGRIYFLDHNAKTATFADPRVEIDESSGSIGKDEDQDECSEASSPSESSSGVITTADGTVDLKAMMAHQEKHRLNAGPYFKKGEKDDHVLPVGMDIREFPGAPWLVAEACLAPNEAPHAGLTANIWFHHPTTPRSHAVKLHHVREESTGLIKLVRSSLRPSLRVFVGANSEKEGHDYLLGPINFNVPLISHLVDLSQFVDIGSILSGQCDDTPLSDVVEQFCADTSTHKKLEVALELSKGVRLELEKKLRGRLRQIDLSGAFAYVGCLMQGSLDSPIQSPRIVIQPHETTRHIEALPSFSTWHKYRTTVTLSLGETAIDEVIDFIMERVGSVAQMIPWSHAQPPTGSMFDESHVSYVSNEHRGESFGDVAAQQVAATAAITGQGVAGRVVGGLLTSLL